MDLAAVEIHWHLLDAMIDAPRHRGDYPDRDQDCRTALEPYVLAMVARLERTVINPDGVALRVAEAIRDPYPDPDDPIAAELAQVSAWARMANWSDAEVPAALRSLAPDLVRSTISSVSG